MNQNLRAMAIAGLRWTVGLVVLWQSYQFIASPLSAQHFAQTGLPQWVRHGLGGSEIIAALLFLMPVAQRIGGYLLVLIFILAALIHILHGSYDISSLAVYIMATLVCLSQKGQTAGSVS